MKILNWFVLVGLVLGVFAGICFGQVNGGRVIHFPADRSIGDVFVQDYSVREQKGGNDKVWSQSDWAGLSQAQGDVVVPAGKLVKLLIKPSGWEDMEWISKLRPDDIYEVQFFAYKATDECMEPLNHLGVLKVLNLRFTEVTNKGLWAIKDMKQLERITLPKKVTNAGLRILIQFDKLKGLYFESKVLTSGSISAITKLTGLEELGFLGTKIMSDCDLKEFEKLSGLKHLLIWGHDLKDDRAEQLANCKSLVSLNIIDSDVTNEGLKYLAELPKLEYLYLYNTFVTDEGLAYLKSIPLKKLNIAKRGTARGEITEVGLSRLSEIKTLESLHGPTGKMTDEGLIYISKLPNLKDLNYCGSSGNPVSDKGLREISKLHLLESLMIWGTGITDEGLADIGKMSKLKTLNLLTPEVTNEGVKHLSKLVNLEALDVNFEKVTVKGLSELNSLKNLKKLKIRQVIQDNSGLDISGLKQLEELSIGLQTKREKKDGKRTRTLIQDTISDKDMVCLSGLTKLRVLWLPSGVSDKGVEYLKGLTAIERLGIGGPDLTDKGLTYLAGMKNLKSLNMTGRFTDEGLRGLEGLKTLQVLGYDSASRFSSKAVQRLHKNLPDLIRFKDESEMWQGRRVVDKNDKVLRNMKTSKFGN